MTRDTAREVIGVCNLCEATCGVIHTVEAGRVTSTRGNPDDPLSRGHICPKATVLGDIQTDPQRLRRPMIRRNGELVETTWAKAINHAVDGLARVSNKHGRNSVGIFLGNPTVHSLGAMTHATSLARVLRTKNAYSAGSIDQLPHLLVSRLMFGHQVLIPIPDIDRTDLMIMFGANPMASNGSIMTVPDFPQRVRELKARGGRLVLFDPRRTETARVATEHHFVRPGTDAFVLLAIAKLLMNTDLKQLPAWTTGLSQVRQALDQIEAADPGLLDPAHVEKISGVSAEVINDLAHDLARTPRAVVYGRMGVSVQAHGTLCQWAINLINIITGHLDAEGGAMFTSPAVDLVGRRLVPQGHFDKWRSRVSNFPEFSGELPVAALEEEITTPGPGQIRAMMTHGGNPVLSTPAGHKLDEALAGLDFMVCIDLYMNETTRHADVILPPTPLLERDHYDLIFNILSIRNTARFSPAALPKPTHARHDWEIIRDLSQGLGRRLGNSLVRRAKTDLQLRFSPTTALRAVLATTTKVSFRKLLANPSGVDLGPLQPQLPGRLFTANKLVQLAPAEILREIKRLTAPGTAHGEESLVLIGRRHVQDCNAWLHTQPRLTKGRDRHHLLMHPDDLSRRGLCGGDQVTVASRVGEVTTEVRESVTMMPGVVSLPHGYGHQKNPNPVTSQVTGVSVNDLTDPGLVDMSGNAAVNGVPVTVTAAKPESATQQAQELPGQTEPV